MFTVHPHSEQGHCLQSVFPPVWQVVDITSLATNKLTKRCLISPIIREKERKPRSQYHLPHVSQRLLYQERKEESEMAQWVKCLLSSGPQHLYGCQAGCL